MKWNDYLSWTVSDDTRSERETRNAIKLLNLTNIANVIALLRPKDETRSVACSNVNNCKQALVHPKLVQSPKKTTSRRWKDKDTDGGHEIDPITPQTRNSLYRRISSIAHLRKNYIPWERDSVPHKRVLTYCHPYLWYIHPAGCCLDVQAFAVCIVY